jgi:small subunit ribosomal protein S3Ae
VHIIAITVKRAKSSQQKFIRETMGNLIQQAVEGKTFPEVVEGVISGKMASSIYHETKKIYPLKRVEIIKTQVVEEPNN